MGTRTVTGTIKHVDGIVWAGGIVKFQLLEPFETASEVQPEETHSETLDANGALTIALAVPDSGTASYLITLPDSNAYHVYLGAGAPTDLMTLITISSSEVAQDAVQTLIDANNVLGITNVTQAYTVLDTDDVVRCNGTFTVTLPAATGSGALYIIKNIDTGIITLDGNGTDTIDGSLTQTITSLCWLTVLDVASGKWDIL